MATNNLRNNFVVIARDASIDVNDNMVSIFKMIDQFSFGVKKSELETVMKNPGATANVPFSCVLCSSWSTDEIVENNLKLTLEYSIIDPEGNVVSTGSQGAEISKGGDTLRFNLNIEGFGYKGDGRYKYLLRTLDDKGKELATGFAYLRVSCLQEPEATQQ